MVRWRVPDRRLDQIEITPISTNAFVAIVPLCIWPSRTKPGGCAIASLTTARHGRTECATARMDGSAEGETQGQDERLKPASRRRGHPHSPVRRRKSARICNGTKPNGSATTFCDQLPASSLTREARKVEHARTLRLQCARCLVFTRSVSGND
jgi:hypothetical protein